MGVLDKPLCGIDAAILAAASRYLAGRRCRSGGYCFYRTDYLEEPNLFDTWHAVVAYALLAMPVPDSDRVLAWLDGIDLDSLGPDVLPTLESHATALALIPALDTRLARLPDWSLAWMP